MSNDLSFQRKLINTVIPTTASKYPTTHAESLHLLSESTRQSKAAPHPLLPQAAFAELSDSAWVRQKQLLQSKQNPAGILPFSAPTLWRMVKTDKFPRPTKLSARVTAWQVGQVRAWMAAQVAA